MESKQLIDGKLVDAENNCLYVALQTYKQRCKIDKNPLIVQMIIDDFKIVPHWYYRSDNWIEQHFLIPGDNIKPYIGPVKSAEARLYESFLTYKNIMTKLPDSIDKILEILPKELIQ
jgi:hypothetical protein